ncbi:MAG: OmpA family protein, partial [Bacteroidetes bacterium]|nr:OmpA family protein [Bacteroidota bacterium]
VDVDDPGLEADLGLNTIIGNVIHQGKNLPAERIKVVLKDEFGMVIQTTLTDKKGSFVFNRLPANGAYVISYETEDTDLYSEMLQVNDQGETIKYARGEELRFRFEKLPPAKQEIKLISMDDTQLQTMEMTKDVASTSSADEFQYNQLPSSSQTTSLLDVDNPDLVFEPGTKGIIGKIVSEKNPTMAMTGVKVVLLDKRQEILEQTSSDQNGIFKFEKLPADGYYIVRIIGDNEDLYAEMLLVDEYGSVEYSRTRGKSGYFYFDHLPVLKGLLSTIEVDNTELADLNTLIIPIKPSISAGLSLTYNKTLYFQYESHSLSDEAKVLINKIIRDLKSNKDLMVKLSSYTDSKGVLDYNLTLSKKRSVTVQNYMRSRGIGRERIEATWHGEIAPVAPNENPDGSDDPEGRLLNRRTEFKVFRK